MDKLKKLLTLEPLKGSRSKWGLLVAAGAIVAEHFALVAPGLLTQHKELWALAEAYFLAEHFEQPKVRPTLD